MSRFWRLQIRDQGANKKRLCWTGVRGISHGLGVLGQSHMGCPVRLLSVGLGDKSKMSQRQAGTSTWTSGSLTLRRQPLGWVLGKGLPQALCLFRRAREMGWLR